MPTLQVQGPTGWVDYDGGAFASSTPVRRYRVRTLTNAERSPEIDLEGFAFAHFLIDGITTNPSADSFLDVLAMSDSGFENALDDLVGSIPQNLFRRAEISAAGAREVGWCMLPPRRIKVVCLNATANFDAIIELRRSPITL